MSNSDHVKAGDTIIREGERCRIRTVDSGTCGYVTDDRGRSYSPIGLRPERTQPVDKERRKNT